jgi:hypothetical protein
VKTTQVAICVSTVLGCADIDNSLSVPIIWSIVDWRVFEPVVGHTCLDIFRCKRVPCVQLVFKWGQFVFINEFLGNDGTKWELHVFFAGHRCAQVEVFDLAAHVFGIGCGECAIYFQFGGGGVSRWCTDVTKVIYEIAPYGESCSIGFRFLRSVIDTYAAVGEIFASIDENVTVGFFLKLCWCPFPIRRLLV